MRWRPRVLIVEDEVLVATALAEMIKGLGGAVEAIAHAYDEATALLNGAAGYDLAFIDLMLGGVLSGVELARQAAARDIQVVAMTGYARLPDGLDAATLLTKPFSAETVRLVFEMLGRRK
jgi:CheY-like chemotaxis protein